MDSADNIPPENIPWKKPSLLRRIFRSSSYTPRPTGMTVIRNPSGEADEGDGLTWTSSDDDDDGADLRRQSRRQSRRPRLSDDPVDSRLEVGRWPPPGFESQDYLTLRDANKWVGHGAATFAGHIHPVPHRSDRYYSMYSTAEGNRSPDTDGVDQHESMITLASLRLANSDPARYPWETLESPSLAFGYGRRPGTITLNHWVQRFSSLPSKTELRDSGIKPRSLTLDSIFSRLQDLEGGLEDYNEDLMYNKLYKNILRDPDKVLSPHLDVDQQIADLILVLSRPIWIDFSDPKTHVVTRYIFDTSPSNHGQYGKFFHQLLLSLELDLRMHSKEYSEAARDKLLDNLPPKIKWDLALSRRWRDYVRIDRWDETPEDVVLRFKLQKRACKMLKRFAQMMKWPNLDKTLEELRSRQEHSSVATVSSHTMAFVSGLVLPGPSFPFLMMNTLLDLDPGGATDHLTLLTHLHPSCGFQYDDAYTYWASACIVGKVLAPTCLEVGGWVGPALRTIDLNRSQIAKIRAKRPRQRIIAEDVATMQTRSDPLGPPADLYPVQDYRLPRPKIDFDADSIRIDKLRLSPVRDRPDLGPIWFDAEMLFLIHRVPCPLRLLYNVSFISAWPCTDGPHPLFFDFVHKSVKAQNLPLIKDWGAAGPDDPDDMMRPPRSVVTMTTSGGMRLPRVEDAEEDDEKVLVVEAFGPPENEVLARAWCAQWGVCAVVADLDKTCMACAIREAYAAALTVVILVRGG